MIIKRLFPTRWARITAWTGAAIAWCVSILAVQAVAASSAEVAVAPESEDPAPVVAPTTQPAEAIPTQPEDGLLIVRFTPGPPPAPRVITQTVVVGGGGGGGGGGGSGGGGGAAPAQAFNPTPIAKVQSAGS